MAKIKSYVKSGWLFVWCISFYNGIFLTFFYVINLPVGRVENGETSPDLSNNYNHTLPVFDCLDRIYNAKFTGYKLRIFNYFNMHQDLHFALEIPWPWFGCSMWNNEC